MCKAHISNSAVLIDFFRSLMTKAVIVTPFINVVALNWLLIFTQIHISLCPRNLCPYESLLSITSRTRISILRERARARYCLFFAGGHGVRGLTVE